MAIIDIDDREVLAALSKLERRVGDLRPVFREIGEELKKSTKKRFDTTTDPDGNEWLLNSVLSTLLYKEGDTPLTGETGLLKNNIDYRILDNSLEIGSDREYAAMQQFGGTKEEFPHLWGDIPARPFLGLSNEDKAMILNLVDDYLL